jgi:hypothetical protein
MNATDLKRKYGYYPIGQQLAKIQASDAEAGDIFGWSVAVSDTRIVVGARGEDTTATNTGSVYIFDIDGNQLAKIQASDAEAGDWFGWSVAVSDNRIVVSAVQDEMDGTSPGTVYIFDINGNQIAMMQATNAVGYDLFGRSVAVSDTRIVVGSLYEGTGGWVYIFDINGNQLAKIQASDTEANDRFGSSVAVSDTRIVVGAPGEDTGANGAGAAYIFDIDGNEIAKIQAFDPPGTSDAEQNDSFGESVAVSDTRIVVGASNKSTPAYGVGAAYIFDINGNEIAKIQASDAEEYDRFGSSVAASDTRIVVGATDEDTTATYAGAAYIFDINGNQLAKIQANDAEAYDYFGKVTVSNNRIVVGAPSEDTGGSNAGSAYIFSPGFSPFGDLCAYYDLGDPTVLDANFSWRDYLYNLFVASGGIVTTYTENNITYKSHTFLSTDTFTVTNGNTIADVLLVAGGGGGSKSGGGGGAGGVLVANSTSISVGTYSITIGQGGAGAVHYPATQSSNGQDTTALSLTAIGGGRGAGASSGEFSAGSGGSGGGGTGGRSAGSGTAGQGNNGENSSSKSGGGGAGQPGGSNGLGHGGDGIQNSYRDGTNVYYGGGGGGSYPTQPGSPGGLGGGGAGSQSGTAGGGTANTGGGGGCGGGIGNGGTGGSGIVIIRYPI